MVEFTSLDWLWAGAFLALMVGGAFFFYKLARRSESDFFLAGRGLPWWLPASSVFSTHTATDTPMWITGVIYANGLRGLWYTFFTAWTAIGAFVSARIFRRSLAYTQAEWQMVRFNGLGAELLRGWLAGWQVFMNMFILGWVGIAMGKICELVFGWPLWVGLVIPSLITAVYTLAAGYWGVVMGDFLQGIVAVFAIVLVSVVGIVAAGGPTTITTRIVELGEAWRLDPLAFTGFASGDFSVLWWLTMLVIAVLGGFGMGTNLDGFVEAQRIQSARTLRDATWGLWAGGAVTLVRNGLWAAAILAFFSLLPNIAEQKDYELGWFRLGFELLPTGLVGVFFGAILAIHLSTISSHLNLGALYFTRDLYQRYLRPDASERNLVWVGRASTAVLLAGSFFYGLMMEEITSWLIFAIWLMMAGVWLPNVLQVVWWRFNAWGYLASWIANLGMSWLVVWVLPAFGVIPSLPQHLQFWLLMLLGALVFVPATLFTRAEPMDRLVEYYAMTRPLGWWGPVRREAIRQGLVEPPAPKVESGSRPLIRREWTAEQAEEWTREDWIAIFLSPAIFAGLLFGLTKAILLQPWGLVIIVASIVAIGVLYAIIDPKLRAVSVEYEARQAAYVERLERRHRWVDDGAKEV
jgi:Na+/proline symporter